MKFPGIINGGIYQTTKDNTQEQPETKKFPIIHYSFPFKIPILALAQGLTEEYRIDSFPRPIPSLNYEHGRDVPDYHHCC
jgi:hypothetical protein